MEPWREPGACDRGATVMSSKLETTRFFGLGEDDYIRRFRSSTKQRAPHRS